MNESHKELLRRVQELFQASERRMAASYDRIEQSIDNCRLAMGGTVTSSSTCCVSEVPAPASSSPDTNLIVATDVEDPAAPTPARCSMEGPSRDSTELRSASAPATAPATPTATVDIIPVLAAAAASDGTLDGEAISGVAGTPATCSMVCLPRHPMAAPVLVASSPPTPTEYSLNTTPVAGATLTSMVSDIMISTTSPSIESPVVSRPPRRPPELEEARYQDCVNTPLSRPWPSFACDIGPVQLESCSPSEDRAPLSIWSMIIGKRSISYGYMISNVLCSPSAIWYWDIVFLWFQRCLSAIQGAQQANENFKVSPGRERPITVSILNVLVTVSAMKVSPNRCAPSFLRTNVVAEEVQRAPYLCEVIQSEAILFTVGAGGCSLRNLYEVEQSSSCNMFLSEAKLRTGICGIIMDHHSRPVVGILGVLVTWPHIPMVKIIGLVFPETSFRTDPSSIVDKLLLVLVQSAALKNMDLCWFTTAVLTEIFSIWFSLQMSVTCSAQPKLLLTHAYQLTCDPSKGSRCYVQISPAPTEYVLDTNSVHVAVVPLAVPDVFPAVPAPAAPTVQLQQLYNDNGDETRPLPWPSFQGIDGCESPSDAVLKPSRQYRLGNLFTSTDCIIINDMCISSELRCLDVVLLFPQYWWSTSEWRCLNDVLWYFDCWRSTTCMQPAHTPISLLCTISGFQLLVMVRSLELKFVSNCSPTFMIVLLDSGAALSSESIVVDTTGCVRSLLSAISSVAGYPEFAVQSPIHYSIASESSSWLLSSIGWMLFARIQSGQNESHILLLPWVLEQEELILEFQFQQSSTMPDWCLRNQSITATGRLYYSLKYKNLAATWRSMFLCVRFLVQLEATCSVQTNWLLTHVCQLTSEPSEESCCCALISLSLHITIQVAYLLQWSTRALVDSESRVYVGVEPVCAAFHAFALLECHPGGIFQSDHGPRCGQRLSSTAACWCALSFHGKKLQDGYVYENLQFAYSASDQGALLFLIQSTALKYVELRWFTSAGLLEILSTCTTGFSRQLYANYSVQSNSQLTDEYPPSVFGPELWIQLDYKDCRATRCALLVANSTMLIFMVVYCGGQETFQGGRHTPSYGFSMMLRLPWDPGKLLQAQAFCDSGSELPLQFKQVPTGYKYYLDDAFASYHLSAFFDVVSVRHDMYFHLVAFYPNSGSYYDSSNIKDHRLQWDPGRFKVKSAWGQAEFQGGRGVRDPYLYMGFYWALITGLAQLSATSHSRCYIYQKKGNVGLIQRGSGWKRLCLPSRASISSPPSLDSNPICISNPW